MKSTTKNSNFGGSKPNFEEVAKANAKTAVIRNRGNINPNYNLRSNKGTSDNESIHVTPKIIQNLNQDQQDQIGFNTQTDMSDNKEEVNNKIKELNDKLADDQLQDLHSTRNQLFENSNDLLKSSSSGFNQDMIETDIKLDKNDNASIDMHKYHNDTSYNQVFGAKFNNSLGYNNDSSLNVRTRMGTVINPAPEILENRKIQNQPMEQDEISDSELMENENETNSYSDHSNSDDNLNKLKDLFGKLGFYQDSGVKSQIDQNTMNSIINQLQNFNQSGSNKYSKSRNLAKHQNKFRSHVFEERDDEDHEEFTRNEVCKHNMMNISSTNSDNHRYGINNNLIYNKSSSDDDWKQYPKISKDLIRKSAMRENEFGGKSGITMNYTPIKPPTLEKLSQEFILRFLDERESYELQIAQVFGAIPAKISLTLQRNIRIHAIEEISYQKSIQYNELTIPDDYIKDYLRIIVENSVREQASADWDRLFSNLKMDISKGANIMSIEFFVEANKLMERAGVLSIAKQPKVCKNIINALIKKIYPEDLKAYIIRIKNNMPFESLRSLQHSVTQTAIQMQEFGLFDRKKSIDFKGQQENHNRKHSRTSNSSSKHDKSSQERSSTRILNNQRISSQNNQEKSDGNHKSNDYQDICYTCKKPGHKSRNCLQNKKVDQQQQKTEVKNTSKPSSRAVHMKQKLDDQYGYFKAQDHSEGIKLPFIWDSGSDICVMGLKDANILIENGAFAHPMIGNVLDFHGDKIKVLKVVLVDFQYGNALVKDVPFYIFETVPQILISKEVMSLLGFDPNVELSVWKHHKSIYVVRHPVEAQTDKLLVSRVKLATENTLIMDSTSIIEEPDEAGRGEVSYDMFTKSEFVNIDTSHLNIDDQVLTQKFVDEILREHHKHEDFSIPIDFEPLNVQIKNNCSPYKVAPRKYSSEAEKFLSVNIKKLIELDMIYKNNQATWSVPAHVICGSNGIPKRLTMDMRETNKRLEQTAGVMPDFSKEIEKIVGHKYYIKMDLSKAYWCTPVSSKTAEIFSFSTPEGIFSSKRMLQGYHSAIFFFQSSMETLLKEDEDIKFSLWVDDLLLWAESVPELIAQAKRVFKLFTKKNVKVNWEKSQWFIPKVIFLGREISTDGLRFDPKKIEGIARMETPKDAAALCKFIHTTGFMRSSILDYARVSEPLHDLLEQIMKISGSRKKKKFGKTAIEEYWEDKHQSAFEQIKQRLIKGIVINPINSEYDVFVFGDASESGWGLLVTQCSQIDRNLPYMKRKHYPLVAMSGLFRGTAAGWTIPAKEVFPFTVAADKLQWLLHREKGFTIVCDNQAMVNFLMKKDSSKDNFLDKVFRWRLKLAPFNFTAIHIEGEENKYADMVSRFINADNKIEIDSSLLQVDTSIIKKQDDSINIRAVHILDSQFNEKFNFPTEEEILNNGGIKVESSMGNGNYTLTVPDINELRKRIFVVAHCGLGGHRGVDATLETIKKHFNWNNLNNDIKEWVGGCIICKISKSPKIIQRPWGENLRATTPGLIIHMDHLILPENGIILVIMDDFTRFCRLIPVETTDANSTIEGLFNWFVDFGFPEYLVCDKGSGFSSDITKKVSEAYGINQVFHTVDVHYNNGAIERINREINTMIRCLLLEFELDSMDWRDVFGIVQFAINHTVIPILGNKSPSEVMTGIKLRNQLNSIKLGDKIQNISLKEFKNEYDKALKKLIDYREDLHKGLFSKKSKNWDNMKNKRKKQKGVEMPKFEIGDYVLIAKSERFQKDKLTPKWEGPYQVVGWKTPMLISCKNITNDEIKDIHVSRIQEFADNKFQITDQWKKFSKSTQQNYEVEELKEIRFNKKNGYEIKVKWKDLSEEESSWQRLENIYKDIPKLVENFLKKGKHNKALKLLRSGVAGSVATPCRQVKP